MASGKNNTQSTSDQIQELTRLKQENKKLSDQVKRLIKAETRLYIYQQELDTQLNEYQKLYELSKKFNEQFNLQKIFEYALEYIIHVLEYERVLFFRKSSESGFFSLLASDGYYDEKEKTIISKISISSDERFLFPLFNGTEYIICTSYSDNRRLIRCREKLLMNEYVIYPLGARNWPAYLMVIGNSAGNAGIYRKIDDNEDALLGSGNLAGLLSSVVENHIYYSNMEKAYHQEMLAKEALKSAQEELIRKEKLFILGQLAGFVGHEIRNPLGVINNAVYYLKNILPDTDDDVKEYLDIIKQEVQNSERIINDLMDFSRTKAPHSVQTSVPDLVSQCINKIDLPRNIDIAIDIPDNLPFIFADPFQIDQVLVNLVTNAVQAMPEGGLICINARPSVYQDKNNNAGFTDERISGDSTQFVEISVKDSGTGINPENMNNLFQPLFTTKTKGIGLGLVICKNLVEANNGRIFVISEVGAGTTFSIELPVAGG
ncbi:MAG: ATP-binding protein [Spirochaetota bacterium]